MSAETLLRANLIGATGVAGYIGTRMSEGPKPEGSAFPCVTFFRVSTVQHYAHEGRGDLVWSRFQVDCWAKTGETSRAIADLLVAALPTFDLTRALLIPESPAPVVTESPNQLLGRSTDWFTEPEPIIWRTRLDFKIWHRE